MPWDPSTPLTRPAITSMKVEETALNLWEEWLGGYFAGANRTIDGVSTAFPLATTTFQTGKLPQPFNGTAISMIWLQSGEAKRRRNGTQITVFQKAFWTVYIRAQGDNLGLGGPKVMVRTAADLLEGILHRKSTTLALARKGIHHIEPRPHVLVGSNEHETRSMVIKAELQYSWNA